MNEQERRWFTFQAYLLRVVDGDTIDFRVDLGFEVHKRIRVRLAGVDTAEIYGVSHDSEEFDLGHKHKDFVENWLVEHAEVDEEWPYIIETEKDTGKYGRYIAEVISKGDGDVLTEDLVNKFPEVENSYE